MENVKVKLTPGEMSTDTRILYNTIESRMVKGGDDFISYGDLNAAIGGRDVQHGARGILRTARKNIEKQHHLLLESVVGEGLKDSAAISGLLSRTKRHISRVSLRSTKRALNAMVDREMTPEEQTEVGIQISLLGAIRCFTGKKAEHVIEGKVRENQAKELPTAQTLSLFSGR